MRNFLNSIGLGVMAAVLLAGTSARAQTFTFLGTEDPTTSLSLSSPPLEEIRAQGDKFYAFADDGVHGWEPWVSDGTPGGTYMLGDLTAGNGERSPDSFHYWNGHVYFGTRVTGTGCILWRTDGTVAGTVKVKDLPGRNRLVQFRESGDVLYFLTIGSSPLVSIWRTDGTEPGTFPLVMPDDFIISMANHAAIDGGLVFFGNDPATGLGIELWMANNTSDSISLVQDINTGASGSFTTPYSVTMNGAAYFAADDGVHGSELWKSDGTSSGTTMVYDMVPGNEGLEPDLGNFPWDSSTRESPLYLGGYSAPGVWKTDGTPVGTVKLSDAQPLTALDNFVELNDTIIFAADGDGAEMGVWVSDGTVVGTRLLKEINPVPGTTSSLWLFTAAGNHVYFRADDGSKGLELWRTDGTPEGTLMVHDIRLGAGSSNPGDLVAVGDHVVFTADDGIHGTEIWVAGSSIAGAKLVVDVEPGATGSDPSHLTAVGNKVVFHATTTDQGPELWAVNVGAGVAAAGDWQLFE